MNICRIDPHCWCAAAGAAIWLPKKHPTVKHYQQFDTIARKKVLTQRTQRHKYIGRTVTLYIYINKIGDVDKIKSVESWKRTILRHKIRRRAKFCHKGNNINVYRLIVRVCVCTLELHLNFGFSGFYFHDICESFIVFLAFRNLHNMAFGEGERR